MPGEEIEITAGVGAFNDQAKPTISIGGGGVPLNVDGVAIKKIKAGGPGEYPINVTIGYTKPSGEKETVNRTIKYTVGQPSGAALMLDKMNVFYIGVDNPITVSSGSGDERTKLSATGGGITLKKSAPGKYIVNASAVGEATITVASEKQNTPFKFRVKKIPDPVATIGGTIKSGKIAKGTLQVQQGIKAILENFDFNASYTVNSFEFTYVPKNGDMREGRSNNDRFPSDLVSAINSCRSDDVFMIEKVKVTGPDGSQRTITGLSVQIKR
jgi:gliding motility-associated protein GldM